LQVLNVKELKNLPDLSVSAQPKFLKEYARPRYGDNKVRCRAAAFFPASETITYIKANN